MSFIRFAVSMSVAVLFLLSAAGIARAGDDPNPYFAKGSFTLESDAAFAKGLEQRSENLTSANVGIGYFIFNNFSLNLDLGGLRTIQTGDDAWMGELSAGFRHYLLHHDRYALFGDFRFGPTIASERVPHDGTDFNFITRAGLGASARLTDNMYLLLGARYFHLSNARIDGPERNPSINGIEGYVGLMWQLR